MHKSLILAAMIVAIFACSKPAEETAIAQIDIQPEFPSRLDSTVNWDSIYVECNREFDRRRDQFIAAREVYQREILGPALSNPMMSNANRAFLRELEHFVWNSKPGQRYVDPVFEHLLMPMFHREGGRWSLFGFERYVESNSGHIDGTFEGSLNRLDTLTIEDHQLDTLVFAPHLFAEHAADRVKPIHLFTRDRRIESIPVDYGYWAGYCSAYHVYPVDERNIRETDIPLIASTRPLDLRYAQRLEIDRRLQQTQMAHCSDCPGDGGTERVFASIAGAERLVFTWVDRTEDHNPSRSLIFVINDSTHVRLWVEQFDQFGCECI